MHGSYTKLPTHFYAKQHPNPVRSPKLVIFNHALANFLGVPVDLEILAGNAIPEGSEPIAIAYSGHQFGHFTMLGDGRALLLGERITSTGERFDIQLKGSGKTKYSRGGDGRAALGPMLREYIVSEAMHAMGIPTTRSLAVVATGETVTREKNLPGAVLTRVASSHIRVGTFEYASRFGTAEDIRALADYTIERHFPDITGENYYLSLLKEVVKRQAPLIAKWQLLGFVHGVMNTDNMAISGETIDYGPCAFMDRYDPATVFSSIDTHGRYSYGNQPKMAVWNLARFAETLLPLLDIKAAQETIEIFWDYYHDHWFAGMRAKLGLFSNEAEDVLLINDLLNLMHENQADYTNTFRALTLGEMLRLEFQRWYDQWQKRLARQKKSNDEVIALMKRHNPAVIPRNHQVEEVLAAAEQDDFRLMEQLISVLEQPYAYTSEQEKFARLPADAICCYRTFCGT